MARKTRRSWRLVLAAVVAFGVLPVVAPGAQAVSEYQFSWSYTNIGEANVNEMTMMIEGVGLATENPAMVAQGQPTTFYVYGSAPLPDSWITITYYMGHYWGTPKLSHWLEGKADAPLQDSIAFVGAATWLKLRAEVSAYYKRSVTFNANLGFGSEESVANSKYDPDYQVTLPDGNGMAREGYRFAGWNTQANGSGTAYAGGAVYTMTAASTVLFAQWTANHAPEPKSQPFAVELPDGAAATFNAADVATDQDNDPLEITHIVDTPEASVARATLSNGQVTTHADAEGSTSLRVEVSDGAAVAVVTVPVTVTAAPTPPFTHRYDAFSLSPDMTGDGRGEILAIEDGTGALYRAAPDKTVSYLVTYPVVSSGLEDQQVYGPGDWNGDKKADVVTVDANGAMWLRKGDGKGGVGSAVQIGRGWSAYRVIFAGDLNSDQVGDLLAVDSSGVLWLYAGDGKGAFKKDRTQVGKGWGKFTCYAAGDLNQDGKQDLLGINSSGLLYAYFGKGNGQFKAPVQVGKGWGKFTLAAGGDLNGDGLADIVGRDDATGKLYYYQSKGGGQFKSAKQIAVGW
ncbi:MAG: FG-GAP-like repeat-containing protein [Bifidobacteriaceae bacterium]|nr:FG-GAP-like repeat-containing protein [Bifidobacteriaceae bacterium]